MKYYTIKDNQILIAENETALTRFYGNVFELPEDYDILGGKYIIGEIEQEIDVPDYEQAVDDEGNPIYDEEGNPVMVPVYIEVPIYDEEGNIIGYDKVPSTHKETITVQALVPNPNYEEEQAEKREADFNKAFFNTSLGYIRRAVTMADGSKKDFLSDLLPAIFASVSAGKTVNLYAYDKPPFDEDVTDWTEYQHLVVATPQFINECFDQLGKDFAPINEE